jgi:hypothetical protein
LGTRIEAIAGEPDARFSGYGYEWLTAPAQYAPVTMYAVFTLTGTPNYSSVSIFSNVGGGTDRTALAVDVNPSTQLHLRADTANGSSNITHNVTERTLTIGGTYAYCAQINAAMTIATIRDDAGNTGSTASFSPGDGWAQSSDRLNTDAASITPLIALAYWAEHTPWQQAMILARLALDLGISAGGGGEGQPRSGLPARRADWGLAA